MRRRNRRWFLWADRNGEHPHPEALNWEAYRLLTKGREIRRSGDGNWCELVDDDGTIAAVLVRYDLRRKDEAA
jgi:hypothetical protein